MVYQQLQKRMQNMENKMSHQNFKISKIIGIEEFKLSPMPGKYLSTNPLQSEHLSKDNTIDEFEEFDDIM